MRTKLPAQVEDNENDFVFVHQSRVQPLLVKLPALAPGRSARPLPPKLLAPALGSLFALLPPRSALSLRCPQANGLVGAKLSHRSAQSSEPLGCSRTNNTSSREWGVAASR
jgi:hypothetical protein